MPDAPLQDECAQPADRMHCIAATVFLYYGKQDSGLAPFSVGRKKRYVSGNKIVADNALIGLIDEMRRNARTIDFFLHAFTILFYKEPTCRIGAPVYNSSNLVLLNCYNEASCTKNFVSLFRRVCIKTFDAVVVVQRRENDNIESAATASATATSIPCRGIHCTGRNLQASQYLKTLTKQSWNLSLLEVCRECSSQKYCPLFLK